MNLNQPLEPNRIYHIYNRGINSEDIFKETRNHQYFLNKYTQYLSPVVDTYAYALLKNHFHMLIGVKSENSLSEFLNKEMLSNTDSEGLHNSNFIVSKQFAKLFSSYTQAINNSQGRTGSLFETPFKRILVEENSYFTRFNMVHPFQSRKTWNH